MGAARQRASQLADHGAAHGRQQQRRAPQIDFYMLSNFSSEPYRQLASRLGARGFFDKSSEFQHVRDLITARATQEAETHSH